MSSSRWVSLEKNDPQLLSYLWGTFSNTERALPVASLNANSSSNKTSFEIVPIVSVSLFRKFVGSLKFKNLIWMFVPALVVLIKNEMDETLRDPVLASLSLLGALCLQMGIELSNDIRDHLQGLDRLHPQSWNQALQKTWVNAHDLKIYSWILLSLGFVLGLPAVFIFPDLALLLTPFFVLGFWFYRKTQTAFKYKAGSELFVFMMFGPLLTVGFQMSFGGGFDLEVFWIGILSGLLAVFQIHLKNFSYLMVNFQSRNGNSVMRWGFDKSKRYLSLWWFVFVVAQIAFHAVYAQAWALWLQLALLLPTSIVLFQSFSKLDSPLGSKMNRSLVLAQQVASLAGALWCFEMILMLLQMETKL